MQYKLYLNLQQRAALRKAISFWEKKEVKDKTIEFFKSCDQFETSEVLSKWHEFTKAVIDEWNKNVLPKKLENELIYIIKMIGETIFYWYQYIKHEYIEEKDAINYVDKICWTPYGTIDEVEILKSSWLENPNLDTTKVYYFACTLALESHINDVWYKIPEDFRGICSVESFMRMERHIMTYWEHYRHNDFPKLIKTLERYFDVINLQRTHGHPYTADQMRNLNRIYDLSHSAEENMLRLSLFRGHYMATKYFWEKLIEDKRNECILDYALTAIIGFYGYETRIIYNYERYQYVEICIFLMNQMTENHKKTFFNTRFDPDAGNFDDIGKIDVKNEVLKLLLSSWPWQELFIPVLKDMLQYLDDDSQMDCMVFDEITNKMVEDHKLGYSLDSSRYRSLLREAWLIIPGYIKRHMIQENAYSEFVDNLINVCDLDTLKLMFNDPEIANFRDELIEIGSFSYRQFIEEDQFEQLDQFIEEMMRSEEEKKQFKQKIDVLEALVYRGRFDLIDKFLDWQHSTPEERQFAKDNIDYMNYCQRLINYDDYILLGMFLDWKFDTDKEKQKFKDRFKSDLFSIKQVCIIWVNENDINSAKDKCYRFLHWFLASEEEIVLFKKRIVVNFQNDRWVINRLAILKRNGVMDDFISWCLLDDEHFQHAQSMKQAVVQSNDRLG